MQTRVRRAIYYKMGPAGPPGYPGITLVTL